MDALEHLPLPDSFSDADLGSFLKWIQAEPMGCSNWDPPCALDNQWEPVFSEKSTFSSMPDFLPGLEYLGLDELRVQPAIGRGAVGDHSRQGQLNTGALEHQEGRFRAPTAEVVPTEETPWVRASVFTLPPYEQLPIMSVATPLGYSEPSVDSPHTETVRLSHSTLESTILSTILNHGMTEWNQNGSSHSKAPWSKTAIISHRLYPSIAVKYLRLLLQNIDADPRDKAKLQARVDKFERLQLDPREMSSNFELGRRGSEVGVAPLEDFDSFMVRHLQLVTWLETGADMAGKKILEVSKRALALIESTSPHQKPMPGMESALQQESGRDEKGKRPMKFEGGSEGFSWFSEEEGSEVHAGETSGKIYEIDPSQDRTELKRMLRRQLGDNPLQKLAELKETFRKGPTKKLGSDVIQPLLNWWKANEDWPYPTEKDKEQLVIATKLSEKQVCNWFSNYRRRYWKCPESATRKDKDERDERDGGCSEDSWESE